MPRFLSLEAALFIHREQIEAHGGAHGLRDQNGLESALGAAEQTFAYTGSLHEAAAQYLVSLSRNHPFLDGNKRIAAACMQRRPASVPSSKLYVGLWPPVHFCQNSVPPRLNSPPSGYA